MSCMAGKVLSHSNIDEIWMVHLHLMIHSCRKLKGNKYSFLMTVNGVDLNEDGYIDLVYGLYGGGVQIYLQRDPSSGISNVFAQNAFSIYPVPASSEIMIRWNDQQRHPVQSFTIRDMLGKSFPTVHFQEKVIDVQNLSAGIYVLCPDGSSRYATVKFTVLR